jgi:hypothetical protein
MERLLGWRLCARPQTFHAQKETTVSKNAITLVGLPVKVNGLLSADSATHTVAIGSGTKALVIDTEMGFEPSMWVLASDAANPANAMAGTVVDYNPLSGALTFDVMETYGGGTPSSWHVVLSGPIGAPGPQGVKGDTGAQGPIGLTGAQGLQGDKGDTGAQGPIGLTGAQGLQGDKGDTGAQGPIGLTGAQGLQGDKGDTGAQGPIGLTGAQGPQGVQGPMGPQGPVGPSGTTDWEGITNKPTTFAPSVHTHTVSDTTGLQAALDGKASLAGNQFTGDQDLGGNAAYNGALKAVTPSLNTSLTPNELTVDFRTGHQATHSVTGNCKIIPVFPANGGVGILDLTNAGGYAITFSTGKKTANGAALLFTTSGLDRLIFIGTDSNYEVILRKDIKA